MKLFSFTIRCVLFALFMTIQSAFAQGILQGTVSDTTNKDILVGANILLKGTAIGGISDIEGRFRIANITPGNYIVRIAYLGYKTKELPVTITDGANIILNAPLVPDVIEGQEVIITAQARGQLSAINQQLKSTSIVNVVSEEKIKELPDANAAEAIGRLPGVSLIRSGGEANKVILRGLSDKFTTITLDGVRIPATDVNARGVDLSMLSQGSLSGIELFKALTSDKDADAIAGSVNLVSRKAPSERTIQADLKGDYNFLMNSANQYDLGVRYGERFFEEIFGLQVSGNLEQRIRSNENTQINYSVQGPQTNRFYNVANFRLNLVDEQRNREGGSVMFDVNTPDSGSIRFNNSYFRTDRKIANYLRNYPTKDAGSTPVYYETEVIDQQIGTVNSALNGKNYLLDFTIDWGASFAESKTNTPFDYYVNFKEPIGLPDSNGHKTSGMDIPDNLHFKSNPEQIIPYAVNNFQSAIMDSGIFLSEKNRETERALFLDLSRGYKLGDLLAGEIKAGGKYRSKSRTRESQKYFAPYYLGFAWKPKNLSNTRFDNFYQRYTANNANVVPSMLDFIGGKFTDRNLYDKYRLYPMMNSEAVRDWYNLNAADHDVDREAELDYYTINEKVTSWYGMNTLKLGDALSFIAGLRVEIETNTYTSRFLSGTGSLGGFPTPKTIPVHDTSYTFTEAINLPNFHLIFRPTEYLTLRFASYKALARPDYNSRLIKFFARGSGTVNAVNVGNPHLRTSKAWNHEINSSIYDNTIGLISLSIFYKEITDDIFMLNNAALKGRQLFLDSVGVVLNSGLNNLTNGDYLLTIPYNSSKPSKVWGFEFEHQANLNYLPGYFQYLVISYNLSIIRSEAFLTSAQTVSDTIVTQSEFGETRTPVFRTVLINQKQKLEGQPEFFGNISLGYDAGDFSARISAFFQGEYNSSFSAKSEQDGSRNGFTKVDVTVKQKVTDNIALTFNLSNLLDISEDNYQLNRVQGWKLLTSSQRYGISGDFGVRVDL